MQKLRVGRGGRRGADTGAGRAGAVGVRAEPEVPTKPEVPTEPTTDELDAALAALTARAPSWAAADLTERLALLEELLTTCLAAGPAWVASAAAAKGIDPDSHLTGEDWGSGVVTTLRNLSLLRDTLTDIQATGSPQPPGMRIDGDRVVVDVMPADRFDRALFLGFSAEVRLQPDVTLDQARERMGFAYRQGREPQPGVALVLGAGNVSSIGPMDALYQLFALDRVVLLKMNPVNAHLAPHLARALQPLIDADLLRIVSGDAQVGRYLTDHPAVDAIHITGSDRTYEAIVFGAGEEGRERLARGEPRLATPITAELGNVSPVIVVPGPWSERDLAYQGDNIASMLVNNAGFNCVAARMIVQHRAWARRGALLEAVRSSLRAATPREPYYPGAHDRHAAFVAAHTQAERFGPMGEGDLPFTLIPALDPEAEDDIAFTTEAFCGVMGEVALDAARSVPAFLDEAVEFCNTRLWGTLSATIIVHPASLKDPEVALAVERAIDELRYGSVIINHFAGPAYGFVSPPWGAYPGSEPTDIQSGTGVVHNTYLLDDVEKTVIRGPFRPPTVPPWFHTNHHIDRLLPRLAELTATGDARHLPAVVWHALRA